MSNELREAAREVLSHREGVQPVRGWLRDNDESRTALTRLADALANTDEPATTPPPPSAQPEGLPDEQILAIGLRALDKCLGPQCYAVYLAAPAVDRGLSEGLGLLIPHLRNGEWNLRTPQELADIIADKLGSALAASAPSQAEPFSLDALYEAMRLASLFAGSVASNDTHGAEARSQRLRSHLAKFVVRDPAPSQAGSCQAIGWQQGGNAPADGYYWVERIGDPIALGVHIEDFYGGYQFSATTRWAGPIQQPSSSPPAPPAGRTLTDDDLRSMWREAGGFFYGPNVEHGAMPEAKLLPYLRAILAASSTTPSPVVPESISRLVDRFLSWPLPDDVCADACASKPGPGRTGTSLLTAHQAEQMLRHVLGIPQ